MVFVEPTTVATSCHLCLDPSTNVIQRTCELNSNKTPGCRLGDVVGSRIRFQELLILGEPP